MSWVIGALVFWAGASFVNIRIAASPANRSRWATILVPLLFGLAILVLWEGLVRGLGVNRVILPPPTEIWAKFITEGPTLWKDFVQTVLKGALSGFVIGCSAGFGVAILVDRSQFLQKGLLPIGNFVAALPIIGIAPIMVKWYGFGWESKSAVVVVMVFFPMLINTVQGLRETSAMQRDLMVTYAASYWQTMFKLRLPAAMPFVFNGLKIASTLALIGAIVAEYFGSPIFGMGFRISAAAGRLAMDMVWAEILVAAMAGSALYGTVTLIEKGVTFWHPSQRK
ncbi:MAG: ABC transporter permease [Marinosulfonomonas sp.]|nr:MAG: ABC transporter permease [Marinosulfonomonas sp.]